MTSCAAALWSLIILGGRPVFGSLGHNSAAAPAANFEIIERYPHRTDCFTEGLSVNGTDPEVFESCGLTGRSYVRRYDLRSGATKQQVGLEAKYFGEGAVLHGESLLVLTYQHRQMLEYNSKTFTFIRTHSFPYGEGWGLTTDGCDLLATTGSAYLYRLRRGVTGEFQLVNQVQVTHNGRALRMLNEVEYITPKLWVNEWITNRIWRVDPITGICEVQIDIGKLHTWRGQATPNGIAYSAMLGEDVLLVTGKLWPQMFALRMSVPDLCGSVQSSVQCPHAPLSACWRPKKDTAGSGQVATVATTATPTSTGPKTLNSTALNSTALYALPNSSKATSKLDLFAMVPEPEGGVGLASDVVGSCMLAAASVSVMLLYWCKHLRGTECFPTVPSL